MWTISMLKQNAWNSLKHYYWMGFLVCFVAAICSDSLNGSSGYFTLSTPVAGMLQQGRLMLFDSDFDEGIAEGMIFLMTYCITMVFSLAASLAIYAFLSNPVEAGKCAYFYNARYGDSRFGHTFGAFKSGRYMKTVKIMFWRMIYTWLWSMLFVIPGLIKSLEYTLIPYLISENPNLSKERVFEISRRTMEGEKANLFLLHLSFIGWYLLGILTCGFGLYFVMPYHQATKAEFYACMRAKMIAQGITTEEELTGVSVY
ncbi:MAG: DUF975 family protein [Oscillospiraceae bacterium]|nr:DUF975 family protein [Oscillospiraceae bacterium]